MPLGERIRETREGMLLSQVEFATRVGVTPRAVQFWESGARTPRMGQLRKLVDVTGKDPSYFLDEEEAVA